jgi:hypothetical protein
MHNPNPKPKPIVSSARRKQWEDGNWEISEWDTLFRLFPPSFTEQLQKWEKEDELERREAYGISAMHRRQRWLDLSDGVVEGAYSG